MPQEKEPNLTIDIYVLDKECAEQPQSMMEAGLAYAQAMYTYLGAKLHRDEVIAAVSQKVRRKPEMFGVAKITEGAVGEAVSLVKESQEVQREVIDAELEMEKAKAIRDAWMQRSTLLKAEVDLWLSNYYANAPQGKSSDKEKKILERKKKLE